MTATTPQTLLVTGANGFVGRHICAALEDQGHVVRRVQRNEPARDGVWQVDNLADQDIPDAALDGVTTVIHLAASLPGRQNSDQTPQTEQIARRVAQTTHRNTVPRMIHLSSIAARLIEEQATDQRNYGREKLAAERAIEATLGPATQLVTLRPPVIYGLDAKGSFGTLVGLVRRGLPLPFGGATAKRCYLSNSNLAALICSLVNATDAEWDASNGKTFEPHDGHAVSTVELVQMIAKALGQNARTFKAPTTLLHLLGRMSGKQDQINAIFDTLQCQDEPSLEECFGWTAHECLPDSLSFLA